MYAILKHGGHQYRVAPGDRLLVDRLTAGVGSKVTLEPVLLVADGEATEVGAGAVSGAHVVATVVAHRRGRKLRVFTYKPKKRRRRTLGHRSQLTELVVEEVAPGGGRPPRLAEKATAEAAATAAAAADGETAPAAEPTTPPAGEAVADAPVEAQPAKRASRPRRKADGA